jgi:hypothetical protein
MRPSLKALRSRAAEKAHGAAAGSAPPAGQEPPPPVAAARPGAIERGNMRRRLRRSRRMREALLTELGALVMEMHRQRRQDPALLERKALEASVADREATGLARALEGRQTLGQVVAAGIAGGCRTCGALLATDDRFCARCGTPARAARNGQAAGAGAIAAPPPSAAERVEHGAPAAGGRGARVLPPPRPGDQVAAPQPPPSAADRAAAPVPGPPPPRPSDRVEHPTPAPPAPGPERH